MSEKQRRKKNFNNQSEEHKVDEQIVRQIDFEDECIGCAMFEAARWAHGYQSSVPESYLSVVVNFEDGKWHVTFYAELTKKVSKNGRTKTD